MANTNMNETSTTLRCSICGKELTEEEALTTHDGDVICQDCYDDGFFTCDDCGEIFPEEDAVRVDEGYRTEQFVCSECAENDYFQCNDCGGYFSSLHMWSTSDRCICDDCADNWVRCAYCGELVLADNAYYDEESETNLCEDCWNNRSSRLLHDYGYKPFPEFKGRAREDLTKVYTYGVELETDKGHDEQDYLEALDKMSEDIYMKHDGSLDCGVEIVTHPASLAYHQYELSWKGICKAALDHGYKSHDAGTCGLHIHIGRRQFGDTYEEREAVSAKLVLLVNALWDEIVIFSRRSRSQLDHWASRPCLDLDPGMTDADLSRAALHTRREGRYQAVNLQNDETVEFRFFRGTLKRDTLIASLQLTDLLVRYAASHTETECAYHSSFKDIVGSTQLKELKAYATEKGLI